MLFIALSDAGTALASSLAPLVIARLGLGAGRCVSESAERGLLADLGNIAPRFGGGAIMANQAAAAAGIALGAPLGGLLSETYGPRACFLAVTGAALVTACIPRAAARDGDRRRIDVDDGVDWLLLLKDGRWRGLTAAEVCSRFGFAVKIASVPLVAAQAARARGRRGLRCRWRASAARGAGGRLRRRSRRRAGDGCGLGPRRRRRVGAVPCGAINGGSGCLVLRTHHPLVYGRRRPSPGAPGS